MNSYERVAAALRLEKPDRVPVYPILAGVNRKLIGASYEKWSTDAETCAACKADLEEKFPQLFFNRSWPFGLEMLAKGTHKGVCAKILKEHFNADVLVCIGDFENDKPMLDAADLSFTPENGWDVLKETVDAVLCDCKDGALGDLIERLPAFLAKMK